MARITNDDKQDVASKILLVIAEHKDGIRESELSDLIGIERRTIHNYLKRLQTAGRVRKDGYNWNSTNADLDAIESELIDVIHRMFDYFRNKQ